MSEEEYFTQRRDDTTDDLLAYYCLQFHEPYFKAEETGPRISKSELRADLLHCLYHNKPKEELDEPSAKLIALAGAR